MNYIGDFGGPDGFRSRCLYRDRVALSQLSYRSIVLAREVGFEPTTFAFRVQRVTVPPLPNRFLVVMVVGVGVEPTLSSL